MMVIVALLIMGREIINGADFARITKGLDANSKEYKSIEKEYLEKANTRQRYENVRYEMITVILNNTSHIRSLSVSKLKWMSDEKILELVKASVDFTNVMKKVGLKKDTNYTKHNNPNF